MPNLDGGHLFLSTLIPIRTDPVPIEHGNHRSHADLLRETLARLPTARQNIVTRDAPLNSPFARNRINHLARFVVIDDVIYNGRRSGDALIARLRGDNPLNPQPVDRLRCSYLFFGADLDAGGGSDGGLRAYTDALWTTMRPELDAIFQHCLGFDGVVDAEDFYAYIRRCQIDTTMPFNDYWTRPIPAKSLPLAGPVALVAIPAVATLIALLMQLLGFDGMPWGLLALVGLAVTAVIAVALYHWLVKKAQAPFPTAPDSTLPGVLKGLYLQQRFTAFAICAQGLDAEALYREFGAFISAERPHDLEAPTQPPGVLSTPPSASATGQEQPA